MNKPSDNSRRRFLGGSALVTGVAIGGPHFSLATTGLTAQRKAYVAIKAPLFDPSLENYPGYSAAIPVPANREMDETPLDKL